MNLCRACGHDFGSVSAFDAHRTGRHAYTFWQGVRREPPVEDGRRCLEVGELEDAGWSQDQHGRWRQPASQGLILRARTAQDASETLEEAA